MQLKKEVLNHVCSKFREIRKIRRILEKQQIPSTSNWILRISRILEHTFKLQTSLKYEYMNILYIHIFSL